MKPSPDPEPTEEEVVWRPSTCPLCGRSIELFDEVVRCPDCKTSYHARCWHFNGQRCARLGCGGVPRQ